jgi:hypothetical protein
METRWILVAVCVVAYAFVLGALSGIALERARFSETRAELLQRLAAEHAAVHERRILWERAASAPGNAN